MDAQAELESGDLFYLSFEIDRPGAMPRAVIHDARDRTIYVRLYEKPTMHTVQVGDREEVHWSFGPHAEAMCRVLNKMPAGDVTLASAMDELELLVCKLAEEFAGIAGMLQKTIANADVPAVVNQQLDNLRQEMLALAGEADRR